MEVMDEKKEKHFLVREKNKCCVLRKRSILDANKGFDGVWVLCG